MLKYFLSCLFVFSTPWAVWGQKAYVTWPELNPADCGLTLECSYRFIETELDFHFQDNFSEGLVPVIVEGKRPLGKGKWGYMDRNGKLAIPDNYELVGHFSEGLAPVKLNGRWGYIDRNNTMAIPAQYHGAAPFSEKLAAVYRGGHYIYINKKGVQAFPGTFRNAYSFREGRAWVRRTRGWGYIDNSGEQVIPPIYSYDYNRNFQFNQGLAPVRLKKDHYIFIDRDGNQALPMAFLHARGFYNDRALVVMANNQDASADSQEAWANSKVAFIDTKGNPVIELAGYSYFRDFREGRALVLNSRGQHYIDQQGNSTSGMVDLKGLRGEVSGSIFDYSQGLAAVIDANGKWGYINSEGAEIIDPQFDEAAPFREGIALVVVEEKGNYTRKFIELIAEAP